MDPWRRASDQVRDAEAELRQADVILVGERFRYETGIPEEFPEPIRVAREVMAGLGRTHAGIDPDEQHPHARSDSVPQSKIFPARYRLHKAVLIRVDPGVWSVLIRVDPCLIVLIRVDPWL